MGHFSSRVVWLSLLGFGLSGCNESGLSQADNAQADPGKGALIERTAATQQRLQPTEPEMSAKRERLRLALEPVLSRKRGRLTAHTNAQGRKVVPLEGGFGNAMMARRGADGKLEYGCFDAVEPAVEFATRAPSEVVR